MVLLMYTSLLVPSILITPVTAGVDYGPEYTCNGIRPFTGYAVGVPSHGAHWVQTPSGWVLRIDADYVAAKGDLTIKETDLSIPGRGLDLIIERIYATPAVFENDWPCGYESPPVDIGKGWSLNFPWIGNLLHLRDGVCFDMIWAGNVFENHNQGIHFKLVKEADNSYTLYKPSGAVYYFDSSGNLKKIEDNNSNKIAFAYDNGLLTNITDTVGRVVYLSYSNSKLSRISYDGMTIDYTYSNDALVKVKDVQGRYRHYSYSSGHNYWLITKATYPEGGYKTYSYSNFSYTLNEYITYHKYKIASEKLYDCGSNLVSEKIHSYLGNYSIVTSSSTTIKDGNGTKQVKHSFVMDSKGRAESFTLLDVANAQTQEFSESHSATQRGVIADHTNSYWEGAYFYAYYIYFIGVDDWVEGYVPVGPFEHYPSKPNYKNYETSVNGDTITVTTHWTVTTVPRLKKSLYTYNSRNEIVQEDVCVGDTDTLSYSIYRRYDDWGNLVYSKNSIGHERSYSYANTETSGVFVDYNGNPITGYSNLFYPDNVSSNIHSALLGKAERQDNGTTIEAYERYDSNGNEIESRNTLCETTSYMQFSGTFDESESTSFPIDLGVAIQGNSILKVAGQPKQDNIQKTESHEGYHKGVDGTGYWNGRYFKAHYFCTWNLWYIDEGYISVGPFEHYPGTSGYKRYTTSVSGQCITVTTYYDVPVDRYPAKVDYRFNTDGWKTITNDLGTSTKVQSVLPSELDAGTNILYFQESSSYATKFSWELYVPIYIAPKEDLNTQCIRDSHGNIISATDAEGAVTLYEYGPEYEHAYPTSAINTVNGFNITTSNTYYFARGLIASAIDPDGYITSFEYDNLGRTTKVINPDDSQRNTIYDDENNIITSYDELGHFSKAYYDGLGRVIKTERYVNETEVYSVETFTYNHEGNILSKTIPHQPDTPSPPTYSFEYDALGRKVKSLSPDGGYSTTQFDDISNIVTFTDAEQHKTEYKYDWARQLLWVKEYYNSSFYYLTQYEYDEGENLIRTIDAKNHVTTREFGSLFGMTKTVYPDSTSEQIAYNKIGNVKWMVNRNGDNTTYTYDEIHRRVETTFADGTTRSFTYDNCSRLIATTRTDYSSTYQYDCRGRAIWESNVIRGGGWDSYDVLFNYDAADRVTKTTYPDGLEICYEYDNLNRITQIYSGEYAFATFSYNFDDTLASVSYGNGVRTTYTYDIRHRPTNIVTVDPNQDNQTMLLLNYTYDNVSNVKQIANGRRTPSGAWTETTETYDYDWLNRLISAQGNFGDLEYSYDAVGNRINKTENGVTTTYQYDTCNRLTSHQSESANATFTYDNMGNLKTKTVNSDTWQYVYNKEYRLTEVVKGQLLGVYSYDANGRRVHQLEGSKTTTTVYSGLNPIHEHIVQSALHTTYDYVYGPIGRIARKSGDEIVYYHCDNLGSTRLMTNASVAVLTTMSYKPFGEKDEAYGDEERFAFNGKEEDPQTGLYYYGARYYDPETGRFTQPDAYTGKLGNPQAQNRYIYCTDNPLKYIDPTGHTGNPANNYNWEDQVAADEMACEQSLENFYKEQKDTETKQALEEIEKESRLKGIKGLVEAGRRGSPLDILQSSKRTISNAVMFNNLAKGAFQAFGLFTGDIEAFSTSFGNALSPFSTGISQGLRAAQDYPGRTLKGATIAATAAFLNQGAKIVVGTIPVAGPFLLVGNSLAGDPLGEHCYIFSSLLIDFTPKPEIYNTGWTKAGAGGGPDNAAC
ncbi:MAG: hypothetical protein OEZ35_05180 [Candidatus Bathyarchaeota archaeon]|nr:hypothetical protein [Candidatus Bathyarchaeota archaeon]